MPSFDAVSEVNLQEIDNAINQAIKEISTRYDFRGSKSSIEFNKDEKIIQLVGDDDFKMKALIDIVQTKAVKRGISTRALNMGTIEDAAGGLKKCTISLVMGIDQDRARKMVKIIKDLKIKVQAQIQEEKVRVSGKKRDDLQEVMAILKAEDFGIPLQFENYRD